MRCGHFIFPLVEIIIDPLEEFCVSSGKVGKFFDIFEILIGCTGHPGGLRMKLDSVLTPEAICDAKCNQCVHFQADAHVGKKYFFG